MCPEAWRRGGRNRDRGDERDREELVKESADLVYHLLVLLRSEGVALSEVSEELDRRTAQSGLAEKAARSGD